MNIIKIIIKIFEKKSKKTVMLEQKFQDTYLVFASKILVKKTIERYKRYDYLYRKIFKCIYNLIVKTDFSEILDVASVFLKLFNKAKISDVF